MKRDFVFFISIISILIFSLFLGPLLAKAASFNGNDQEKMKNARKVEEVKVFIKALRSQGVIVKLDPVYYCKRLDRLYLKHPNLRKEEVAKTLKTLMIMEYDWEEKGVDKDALAKEWLGEELYNKNKTRRGVKQL